MAERADAARNRAAILAAAERLLTEHGRISVDHVAREAGVAKATVFHRFGSRSGLLWALIEERVRAFDEAIESGPPPLGPGVPAPDRLVAFFDAVVEMATKNVALITGGAAPDGEQEASPAYQSWHRHVSGLVAQCRPDLDSDLLAHMLLGGLHTEPVGLLLRSGDTGRLTELLHELLGRLLR